MMIMTADTISDTDTGYSLSLEQSVSTALGESIAVKQKLLPQVPLIIRMAEAISGRLEKGGKVLFFGNGGSAADAQHLAAELVGKFKLNRRALAALALTTDTSILTAISNDFGQEYIFSRQVEALATEKDTVITISTSGRSQNVINGLKAARAMGTLCIGLSGEDGGTMQKYCDLCLMVPSRSTPRIQEAHITVGHILCDLIESKLAEQK